MAESLPAAAEFAVFDGDLDPAWTERYLGVSALAVDTEAMGLVHGRDRLCLVQIADENDRVACIRIALGQSDAPRLRRLMEASKVELFRCMLNLVNIARQAVACSFWSPAWVSIATLIWPSMPSATI